MDMNNITLDIEVQWLYDMIHKKKHLLLIFSP